MRHFGRSNPQAHNCIDRYELQSVECEKDLGVTVSANFKVSSQCQEACSRSVINLGLIRRTFASINVKVLLSLYKSLVHPYLEY